ncbi:AMP-binding protein [uncultured Sphaerochaeta sp.]|uniref:AMP-binding protein n=1 Tax=uncultured Sphaerochaeta sp. TaxID=886478 RepID=UPI002AA6E1AC|nr:AMP-binding protein [uncultured Sphaerochaeta sp.]
MKHSWDDLDQYRGILFEGQWPTIIDLLLITEQKFGGRNGFTVFKPNRETLTFSEILQEVTRVSSYLQECGIVKGDHIVINGKNSPAWAIAYLAILHAGAIVVPLDNQMNTDRVETLSSFVNASYIFADKNVLEALDTQKEWFKELKGCSTLLGESESFPSISTLKAKNTYNRIPSSEHDIASILFTSGTTGNEKGAMLTHANIVSDLYQACDGTFLSLDETDVLYALLPLHHSYCCTAVLLESIKHGAECVFGQDIVVSKMINDLREGKVTIFMGIPLLYNKLLAGIMKQVKKKGLLVNTLVHTMMVINGFTKKHLHWNPFRKIFNKLLLSKIGLDRNNFLICGAGPLAPKVFKQYQQLGLDFIQGYGLTETSPILTLNPISHFKVESVGMVFPLVEMKIAEPDENGVGEIRVKGPNITQGYYNDPVHTAELFDEEGYLKTGDLGYLDKENYLYLKGRAKNIIVTEGGKNVYPEEIEDLFQLYSQVEQILIRGYQEKKNIPSELIEAVIYPNAEYYREHTVPVQDDLERVIKEVNQRVSGYKKITKLTITNEPMDMTSTKKIKRNKVTA